ncbi:MAG: hypothetical protein H7101_12855 [Deinococcales bacterium]|nr:hypothetical protein [Chitinophagaceae bacterium]
MKKNFKLLLFLTITTIALTVGFISCRKSDLFPNDASISLESKFFNTHRTAEPVEKTIVDFLERENNKKHFVEKTANQIGYPRWDKIVKRPSRSATVGNITTLTVGGNTAENTTDVYYVPFVRDSQNYVNASMVVKVSPTDTSFGYLCDWQYSKLQNNTNALNDKAEDFAIFFMRLDNQVFGHTKFKIDDKSIFRANNHDPYEVTLKTSATGNVTNLLEWAEYCANVTVTWTYCSYTPCNGPNGTCDNCYLCTRSNSYTYCWNEWTFGGGDGSGFGPGSGGPSSGGGGSTPPNPCGDQQLSGQSTQNQSGGISTFRTQCSTDPGWTPGGGANPFNPLDPGENFQFIFQSDPATDLAKLFKCFDNVPDAGATFTVKLCADLPDNNQPLAIANSSFEPGHSFITMTKTNGNVTVSQSFGFYPTNGPFSLTMLPRTGKVVDNGDHEYNASTSMNISAADFKTTQNTAILFGTNMSYDLNDFNCTTYALTVYNSVRLGNHISVANSTPGFDYGKTPGGLYQLLKNSNPVSNNIEVGTFSAPAKIGPCN